MPLTLVSRFEIKGVYFLEDLAVDLAVVSTTVGITLTSLTDMLVQLLSFAPPFLDGPFSEFDLSDWKGGKRMETCSSNTVRLHLLLCWLDRACILHIVEVDGTAWMERDSLLDIQNIWLCSEICFAAVSSLRDPWHSETTSLVGHSISLLNILQ